MQVARHITKWLPIIFGCHCKPERSFHFHGKQFPICARCTGELIGILVAPIALFIWDIPYFVALIILLPLIIDGGLQSLTRYTSNNLLRLITGILFGYGLFSIFIKLGVAVFWLGYYWK